MCRKLPGLRSLFFTISLVQRNSRKETARDSPFLGLTLAASFRGRKVKGFKARSPRSKDFYVFPFRGSAAIAARGWQIGSCYVQKTPRPARLFYFSLVQRKVTKETASDDPFPGPTLAAVFHDRLRHQAISSVACLGPLLLFKPSPGGEGVNEVDG